MERWVEPFIQHINDHHPVKPAKKNQGEERLHVPFSKWLVEQEICEAVSKTMPYNKHGLMCQPDLIGYRTTPEFTIVLVEMKDNVSGRDLATGLGQALTYLGVAHEVWLLNNERGNFCSGEQFNDAIMRTGIGVCTWKGRHLKFKLETQARRQEEPNLLNVWDAWHPE
jgi:hypothetical protein